MSASGLPGHSTSRAALNLVRSDKAQMLIGQGALRFISELNTDLAQKSLALASVKLKQAFPRFVPWMCLVCLRDLNSIDTSILYDEYVPGELLVAQEKLFRIAEFLRNEGRPIVDAAVGPTAGLPVSVTVSVMEDVDIVQPDGVACFNLARELLLNADPLFSGLFRTLVHLVVPMRSTSPRFGYSSHLARGAIFLSLAENEHSEIAMAIDLAHELGHQALMVFQSADPLLVSPLDEPLWSGIRQTYRPAIQCIQAAAALSYMIIFTRSLISNSTFTTSEEYYIEENYNSQIEKIKSTLYSLKLNCRFTNVGERIIDEFERVVEESNPH